MNTYGYAVYKCGNFPAHIVEVKSTMAAGFHVFSNAKDAKNYILREKERFALNGVMLSYDPDYKFCKALVMAYTESKRGMFSKIENKEIYINS